MTKPNLSKKVLDRVMAQITLMRFFPSTDIAARTVVAMELLKMCGSDEQALWLGDRFTHLHTDWPGLHELRATLCSKFRPADGIEVYSGIFGDGVPSEKPEAARLLPDRRAKRLSNDPEMNALVSDLARNTEL